MHKSYQFKTQLRIGKSTSTSEEIYQNDPQKQHKNTKKARLKTGSKNMVKNVFSPLFYFFFSLEKSQQT